MEIAAEASAAGAGLRTGKAYTVADALASKGFTIDRAAELTISAALAASDAGDARAQCRAVEVVWLLYLGQSPGDDDRKLFEEKREVPARGGVWHITCLEQNRHLLCSCTKT